MKKIKEKEVKISQDNIWEAIKNDQVYFLDGLITNKIANLNDLNQEGQHVIHFAARNGNIAAIEKLVELGADINAKDNHEMVALHLATEYNRISAIEKLVELGADVNAKAKDGSTPLHLATEYNRISAIEKLVGLGADINSVDMQGIRPLEIAAINKHLRCFKLLLEHEASLSSIYNKGMNLKMSMKKILEEAVKSSFPKVLEFILENYSEDITTISYTICATSEQKLLNSFIKKGFDHNKFIIKSDSKIIQAVINIYGVYPPIEHPQFRYGELVIRTLDPEVSNESYMIDNVLDKKKTCKLDIKDGLIYHADGVFTTDFILKDNPILKNTYIWVLDHHGQLFAAPEYAQSICGKILNHHSFFSKKDGFGKPIACGGQFEVRDGKIIRIDANSGHYKPSKDQLILAIQFFNKSGVISDKVTIEYPDGSPWINKCDAVMEFLNLQDVLSINPEYILSKYPLLEGYITLKAIAADESNINIDSIYAYSSDDTEVKLSGDKESVDIQDTV